MSSAVVDTDVVSYEFKRDTRRRLYRPHLLGREAVVSFMTVAELDEWAERRRWGEAKRQKLARHVERFPVYYADRHLCRLWAEVRVGAERRGRPIDKADAWIAATALALGVELITNNPSDFAGVEGLRLLTAVGE